MDAYSLVEYVSYYSRILESKSFEKKPSLNLLNGYIYIDDTELVNLSYLYVIYLEKTFQLSNGFKALVEDNHLSAKKIFSLFAKPEIQDEIKNLIFQTLTKHKVKIIFESGADKKKN